MRGQRMDWIAVVEKMMDESSEHSNASTKPELTTAVRSYHMITASVLFGVAKSLKAGIQAAQEDGE